MYCARFCCVPQNLKDAIRRGKFKSKISTSLSHFFLASAQILINFDFKSRGGGALKFHAPALAAALKFYPRTASG